MLVFVRREMDGGVKINNSINLLSSVREMGCVYLITHIASGKCYVGQTTQHDVPDFRWARHLRQARGGLNYPLHRAIRLHGEDAFTIETLFVSSSQTALNNLESLYAMGYFAYTPFGYNDAVAGKTNKMAGKKHTEQARAKMRAAKRNKNSSPESSGSELAPQ